MFVYSCTLARLNLQIKLTRVERGRNGGKRSCRLSSSLVASVRARFAVMDPIELQLSTLNLPIFSVALCLLLDNSMTTLASQALEGQEKEVSVPLTFSNIQFNVMSQGSPINQPGCGLTESNRIVNGRSADERAYPFAVELKLNGKPHCGGAVIGANWVLTAAHCFKV